MKTNESVVFLLPFFLTVEPSDADGFNKHSKENRCSCGKVVQQSKNIHASLKFRVEKRFVEIYIMML